MKKFFTLVLAAMMLFAFVACDSKTPAPAAEKEYSKSAALASEWGTDRTEPKSFEVTEEGITIETTTANLDTFYRYQGKKTAVKMDLASSWKASASIDVTKDLLNTEGGAVSIWLNVQSEEMVDNELKDIGVDWTIIELITGENAKYHFWDSNDPGKYKDVSEVTPAVGKHTFDMEFDNGEFVLKIDGTKIATYEIKDDSEEAYTETKIVEVIIQSLNNGSSYSASWSIPEVKYNPVETAE